MNDYGQTDYQIDLFNEIEKAYDGELSIFDSFKPSDVIMAFFPCTRFEAQILLSFRGDSHQIQNEPDILKLERDIRLHKELHKNYVLISKLAIFILKRGLRMVFENPLSEQHYLTRYWCLKPAIKDQNRRLNGDYMKKPTQYWFIGCEPTYNIIMEPIDYVKPKTWSGLSARERSEIHPQYANRFIRQYIL